METKTVGLKAQANEILAKHLEYMGWPESGQVYCKTSAAIAAVEEALTRASAALREALEEAREAIGIYGYATVHGRRVRQSWATEALAKIDAALLSDGATG